MKMWQQIENTEEAICYERKSRELSVRIEARQSEDDWTVYRGFYSDNNLNYTEQFSVSSREDAERMMFSLRKERIPSVSELSELVKTRNRKVHLSMKRAYKDDMVEKWFFTVNDDPVSNFFVVKEYEKVEMDIVLHESYKDRSSDIVKQILRFLSYENVFVDIEHSIYFFSKMESACTKKNADRFEIEFDLRPKAN